ncbi:MAG: hypothetical protein FJ280_31655 [Planctomycetes bacterium]|nr:hypothetical protein [Planctomycetota bacterium]
MKVEIYPESDFLRTDVSGKFSLKEAKRTFLEILDAVTRYKVNKVLFDGRRIVGNPQTMERFYYGEFVAEAWRGALPLVPKFAYVLEYPVLDPARFGETVAVNRGMIVKAFDNLDDALGWLGISSANKPDAGDGI